MLLWAFRVELIGRYHAIAPRAHDMRARLCYETVLFFTRLESQKYPEAEGETYIYLPEDRSPPAPSKIKPKGREFVVDSGASMHMISKKDLNSAELETVTTSRSPMVFRNPIFSVPKKQSHRRDTLLATFLLASHLLFQKGAEH